MSDWRAEDDDAFTESRIIMLWEARKKKTIKQKFYKFIAKIVVSFWFRKQMREHAAWRKRMDAKIAKSDDDGWE